MGSKMKKVRCIRNDSKALPYHVGSVYAVGYNHGGGNYEIYDGQGSVIIAPLKGHYLEFVIID